VLGGRCNKHPHSCRPSSALVPTYIGTTAEPVLFFYNFFLLLFFFFYLYGVWWSASVQPISSHPSASNREWAFGRDSSGQRKE